MLRSQELLDASLGKRPTATTTPGLDVDDADEPDRGRLLASDELLVRDVNYPPSVPLANPEW
eukprot:10085769-Prorocentrum_lima.AAC.1